jgi:hypothetical protein
MTPSDIFQGSGANFVTFGKSFQVTSWFIAHPSHRLQVLGKSSHARGGFITWQANGQPVAHLGASTVGPDQGVGGSGISKRPILEEPMAP